jgi:organic radical activating enzyme
MSYAVKEIFLTLQGEGLQAGRAAVFLRFAGCNLWSGREEDRATAECRFCDTDFVGMDGPGGGRFATAEELAEAVAALWPSPAEPTNAGSGSGDSHARLPAGAPHPPGDLSREGRGGSTSACRGAGKPYVICTGGEPLLQLDAPLIAALHARGFEVGVETNGTVAAPAGLDWICVSPKARAPLIQRKGDELKLVYPQEGLAPCVIEDWALEELDFGAYLLQPMDGPAREENTNAAAAYCLAHPKWRLSLQTHKWIGLP